MVSGENNCAGTVFLLPTLVGLGCLQGLGERPRLGTWQGRVPSLLPAFMGDFSVACYIHSLVTRRIISAMEGLGAKDEPAGQY